ncbi:MAG: hypothetical protein A2830_00090 [Candidatus Taylorbacteria bacterium RIFCSPHIGHO2_01_FULL_44_110]|uniref:Lecithin:cholesterol acyltransferase n=1 Tax=Candidatus Taylorbacteria bacterium RIFCSPHIGHO2_12_FULL_45_16 TaxID=1802315 RepID=A0A1G2N0Q9_9BACT|nr:MAG: hypothetical protein A2830_00090 [Candidatus Taylorbacteria bacterium RIFCSPHIGHO2_01_FULL_44_110]OHA28791.1 MAG: hypothetical protein A3F51_02310 [Candidatus Taylorbacteria bacterium RIFCSPHIGHO2_12_FULL_45_16]OHA32850.1 MAG: hypothetical protein A3A23_03110 [Candidatus Taylorbacteria bacterium RIFCSPLOWO2_01_FULL_45_59]OHA38228.1 MAG: hypothetical protein A3I98_02770 [Candidatus Taylorbacteria bacterium RIFCSPLOWO2_02_FULL_45_10b]
MATGLIAFIGFLPTVRAETIITDGFLLGDTVWDKVHSPYILSDTITVSSDMTLTIEPGVEVRADPASEYEPYMYIGGTLSAHGSEQDPIRIVDIFGITIDHGRADISYASIFMKGTLTFVGAEGYISTTTISNVADGIVSDGIGIENSLVTIQGSKIEGNGNGITVKDSSGIFQVKSNRLFLSDARNNAESSPRDKIQNPILDALAKIGLAKISHAFEFGPSYVTITGSSLLNNREAAIVNNTSIDVRAEHNWWGSVDGPRIIPADSSAVFGDIFAPNGLKGPIAYDPWLVYDPFETKVPSCCSSVVFLPGFEASRLYRLEQGLLGFDSSVNQLWEPNRNDDVRKLFLNPDGTSVDSAVYAGDPIGKALGLKDVYGSFMNFLDGLLADGKIAEWESFGYDWRRPVQQIAEGGTRRATTTRSLLETVEQLASRSRTGKVTLIAHSNGGLVVKYLVKTLTDMGKENLIDSVISVAVPYLGTPQAILGLLHGDNQSIFGGLILKKSVAKELGLNMSSAYSLIPSAGYFTKVFGPTIAYANGTTTSIDSSLKQNLFIGSRTNLALMKAAEIVHGILDPFSWPANIARWAIVGWGNKTAKGVVYSGTDLGKYNATTTSMGDGTVVAQSAAYNAGTTTAINLPLISKSAGKDIYHSNILGATATQKAIENLVMTNNHNQNAKIIEEELIKIPGVTIGEPDYSQEATFLVVSTHSPVELHVYDDDGNHTGMAPLPAGTDEEIEEGLYTYVENNIRGSSFEIYGDEDQPETYISLPDDGGQTYSVAIQGIGVGEFTYNVERIRGGDVLDSITYAGLPATPLMTASTTISTQVPRTDGTVIPIKLASSTPALKVDIDGNGSTDITVKANTKPDPKLFLESLEKTIIQLVGLTNRSKNIIRRIDRLQGFVKDGKLKKIHNNADKLKKVIKHKKVKLLSAAEKDQIVVMIDAFLAQFE